MVPQMWMTERRMRYVHLDAIGNGQSPALVTAADTGSARNGRAGIPLDGWKGLRFLYVAEPTRGSAVLCPPGLLRRRKCQF
jgi:hypothetical protein